MQASGELNPKRLNNRPRKKHQYKNPIYAMEKLLFNSEIAFMS